MKLTLSTMLVAAGLTLGLSGVAAANSTDETSSGSRTTEAREGHEPHIDGVGASRGDAQIMSKIVEAFTEFAGSPENAASLVAGLRSGSEITLAGADTSGTDTGGRSAASKSPTTSTPPPTTFTSPTGPMSNGNVYLSLALAKDQLTGVGIDNPTPQQIAAALNGGTINTGTLGTVELQGVLQLRAEGLGWGRIAQAQGTKLGWVMGEMKSANTMHFVSVASHSAGGATESGTTTANGERVAASKGSSGATDAEVVDAGGEAHGNAGAAHSDSGRGIHNALGGNAASGREYGDGKSEGHGVIAATGASAGGAFAAAGIVNAGGGGQGNAAAAGVLGGSSAGLGHAAATAAASNTPGAGVVSAAGGGDHGHAYGHGHERGHGHGYGHGK